VSEAIKAKYPTPDHPARTWTEVLEDYRPGLLDLRNREFAPKKIEPKVVEFLILAIESTIAWRHIEVQDHISNAFDNNATVQELIDVFLVAGNLRGAPCVSFGLSYLDAVIQQRLRDGKPVPRE